MSKRYRFVLYLLDQMPENSSAYYNLRELADKYLGDSYVVEVIDLRIEPAMAHENDIFATPTIDRIEPLPRVRIIGDLSDTETVITQFGLKISKGNKL